MREILGEWAVDSVCSLATRLMVLAHLCDWIWGLLRRLMGQNEAKWHTPCTLRGKQMEGESESSVISHCVPPSFGVCAIPPEHILHPRALFFNQQAAASWVQRHASPRFHLRIRPQLGCKRLTEEEYGARTWQLSLCFRPCQNCTMRRVSQRIAVHD